MDTSNNNQSSDSNICSSVTSRSFHQTEKSSTSNGSISTNIGKSITVSSNSSSTLSKFIQNNPKPTLKSSKSKLLANRTYNNNYCCLSKTPFEHLVQQKQNSDLILGQYQEGSEIYHPAQYGECLSDDDISILKPDIDLNKKRSKAAKKINITEQPLYSRFESKSWSHSTYSNNAKDVPIAGVLEKKDRSIIPFDIEAQNETVEDNVFVNHNKIEKFLAQKESEPTNIFKEKIEKINDRAYDFFHSSRTCCWFWMIIIIIVFCFFTLFFPIASSLGLFHFKEPNMKIHEHISDYIYPTLSAIRTSMVDPDTPKSAHKRVAKDGDSWDLVFSDEFNAEGRTFYSGMDQFWEAVDLNYAATNDLEWYDPDAAITKKGSLNIQMDSIATHGLNYRSAMLQSWNKLCFTEGILEISAKLPGSSHSAGLWPGLWILGNLARPGYMASTEGVWPYSYDECDAGITPGQSSDDGLSKLPGQKLNKCVCKGSDHPNPGVGRGAPEIDILEGAHSAGPGGAGVAAQTLQIAPFDIWYTPDYEFVEVYNFSKSNIASYLGTPYQEMLSTVTVLNDTWFEQAVDPENSSVIIEDSITHFQKYSVEYRSNLKKRNDNYCRFFVGDEPVSTIYGNALHPNGNIGWREMPKEPMSIILNLGISTSWTTIQWLNILFPVILEIDYVRIYQPKGMNQLTCNPKDYPTSDYIQNHLNAYMNPNLTTWEAAGYTFPENKLTSKCKKKND